MWSCTKSDYSIIALVVYHRVLECNIPAIRSIICVWNAKLCSNFISFGIDQGASLSQEQEVLWFLHGCMRNFKKSTCWLLAVLKIASLTSVASVDLPMVPPWFISPSFHASLCSELSLSVKTRVQQVFSILLFASCRNKMALLTNIPGFRVHLYRPFLLVALLLVERCGMKDVFLQAAASVTEFVCGCSFLGVPVKHTLNFPDLHSHEQNNNLKAKRLAYVRSCCMEQRFEKRN